MKDLALLGLDIGTTTSSAVVASASLTRNSVTGRTDLTQVRERFRSEMLFTPFRDDCLDEPKLAEYLESWLAAGQVQAEEIFGGGALLTGLAARADNAAVLGRLIRARLDNALIATADDPCLESWLAFLGSCAALSRAHPERWVINLDIGGGTTNLALGRAGEVLRTGCLFVGARHIQVRPGTYAIERVSTFAQSLLDSLGVAKGPGDTLTEHEVDEVLDFDIRLLQAAVSGQRSIFADPVAKLHEQVPFGVPVEVTDPVITLSGGVGELIYRYLDGQELPPRTHFGDLGIDLALCLLETEWANDWRRFRPAGGGRATVYGLLRHHTQISGNTLFLPHPEDLPLADLPIVGAIGKNESEADVDALLDLLRRNPRGGCLRIELADAGPAKVRAVGSTLAQALRRLEFPPRHPLVIFVRENVGKVLGHYISEWGAVDVHLVVIDEICVRDAQYAHLGTMREQVVPVSVYGLNPTREPQNVKCDA